MAWSDTFCIHFIAVTVTVALYLRPIHGNPCISRQGKITAYRACFNNEGIRVDDVFNWYRDQVETKDMTEAPHEKMFANHGDTICSNNATSLKNAIRCSYQTDMNCALPMQRKMMINPNLMARAMDSICANRKDINFTCLIDRHDHVMRCAAEQRDIYIKRGVSLEEIKCFIFKVLEMCTKREFKVCGCPATKTYSDIAIDLLTPKTCYTNDTKIEHVVCSKDNSKRFLRDGLGGGGTSHFLLSSSSLSLAVACFYVVAFLF